ncbi:Dna2/Cas4 domain-containing protein, partial [Barnesiella intestinihominis]|uniref:Dna2/Cas4 domain-containing protein n=1 Tax=Barnesiella intestinihominis TaxID=487174 RepID=UPI003AB1AB74
QLSEPEKQCWFKAGNRILNEQEILHPKQGTYRPDRIVIDNAGATVIDYKFGAERSAHRKQVAGYMSLLQEMGYKTRGYIWYVPTGKVIPVET